LGVAERSKNSAKKDTYLSNEASSTILERLRYFEMDMASDTRETDLENGCHCLSKYFIKL
jgi:hypothetical protein